MLSYCCPEPNAAVSATTHDLKVVSGISHALEINTDVHAKVVRLKKGDPHASHYPLIRVEFSDPEIRKALLHNLQRLRKSTLYKIVYVRPDLTPAELAARKLPVAALKQCRADGENVLICNRSNRVIPRTMAAA